MHSAGGSYPFAGQTVTFVRGRVLILNSASFAFTGRDAILTKTGALTMVTVTGTFPFTGRDVTLQLGTTLSLSAGSYAFNGQSLIFVRTRIMLLNGASFAFTGHDVILQPAGARKLEAITGTFSFTGFPVEMFTGFVVPPTRPAGPEFPPLQTPPGALVATWLDAPVPFIVPVRTARPSIVLGGKDYYSALAPYLLNLSYTDNCDGERADDLQLQLADRDRRFISDWRPDPGVYIDVAIICERWSAPNAAALSLDCGRFWIDSVEFDLPSHTVSVKASSLPTDQRIKTSNEIRGWENSSLRDIAEQVAGENGMTLDYQSSVNPRYKRVEQVDESGLAFLKKRANEAKLSIKVHRNTLVFFDEQDYEAKAPQFTLVYGNAMSASGLSVYRMDGGHFSLDLTDATKKAKVSNVIIETGKLTEQEFSAEGDDLLDDERHDLLNENPGYEPDEASDGQQDVPRRDDGGGLIDDWNNDSPSDNAGVGAGGKGSAARRAKAHVRDKNKNKNSATVELSIGNPLVAAGMTLELVGLGQFDGKWFVVSATHDVAPQYNTKLSIRRCLEGY